LEAAHHRIAADLLAPFADLPEDGEVFLVHLDVGLAAERADVAAAEGVEVEPREDVRVRGGELDHRARLGLARAERPGADLLVVGLPAVGKIAVESVSFSERFTGVGTLLPAKFLNLPLGPGL